MELRNLRYFVAVAREENMTKAANQLHVTQPTLSKALKKLESELGKKLFVRHAFRIELTDEGILLQKRAQDLLAMADKIEQEFQGINEVTGGDVYLGMAESYQVRYLARFIKDFRQKYPDFRYHILSGDTNQVNEKLDKGILDFTVLAQKPDELKYDYFALPQEDSWGLVLPQSDRLAQKKYITYDDLKNLPLFVSNQAIKNDFANWCSEKQLADLNFEGTFQLSYNGSIFVKEGLGYLLTFEHLIATTELGLVFKPLVPKLTTTLYVAWRKHQTFTPIAKRFLEEMQAAWQVDPS